MDKVDKISPAKVYEEYLGRHIADPFTRVLLDYAEPKPGERVLDLACGTGSVARHVAPMVGAEGRVTAMDINSDMLGAGRAAPAPAGATIEWLEGDAARLDLPDRAFDLVTCQQGLQFFADRSAAPREMRRVLTGEGRGVFSVWQELDRHPLYRALFEATARHLGTSISDLDVPFSLGDAGELRTLLETAGFRRIEIAPRSLKVRLPSPERFVQFTVAGAATSVPAFIRLTQETRAKLVEAVARELDPVIKGQSEGGVLTFPMFTHIAVAS